MTAPCGSGPAAPGWCGSVRTGKDSGSCPIRTIRAACRRQACRCWSPPMTARSGPVPAAAWPAGLVKGLRPFPACLPTRCCSGWHPATRASCGWACRRARERSGVTAGSRRRCPGRKSGAPGASTACCCVIRAASTGSNPLVAWRWDAAGRRTWWGPIANCARAGSSRRGRPRTRTTRVGCGWAAAMQACGTWRPAGGSFPCCCTTLRTRGPRPTSTSPQSRRPPMVASGWWATAACWTCWTQAAGTSSTSTATPRTTCPKWCLRTTPATSGSGSTAAWPAMTAPAATCACGTPTIPRTRPRRAGPLPWCRPPKGWSGQSPAMTACRHATATAGSVRGSSPAKAGGWSPGATSATPAAPRMAPCGWPASPGC